MAQGRSALAVLERRAARWRRFGRERSVTTRHIQRALANDELSPESNMQKVHGASSDKPVSFYSLDAVISVGHRECHSSRAWPVALRS